MKKFIYLAIGVMAVASSCSNDETIMAPTNEGNTMGFSAFVNNGVSGRADLTMDNLEGFKVWGSTWTDGTDLAQVFTDQDVNKNGTDWVYSPLRYWIKGNNYRFSAIAPANGSYTVEQSVAKPLDQPKGGVKIDFDAKTAAGAQDLIYAFKYEPTVAANQAPVDLEFNHLLSRVMFTFENQCKSKSIGLKVSEVTIQNAPASASINMVGEDADDVRKWVLGADTYVQSFVMTQSGSQIFANNEDNMTDGFAKAASNHYYIVPAEVDARQINVSFTLEVYSFTPATNDYVLLNTYEKSVIVSAMTMNEGYSYNFVAALDETNIADEPLNPIEFNVIGVNDWEDWTSVNTEAPAKPETPAE